MQSTVRIGGRFVSLRYKAFAPALGLCSRVKGARGSANSPFRFRFYSDEGIELAQVHVGTANGECKFWLDPVSLASNRGIRPNDLRTIENHVYDNRDFLLKAFYAYHAR